MFWLKDYFYVEAWGKRLRTSPASHHFPRSYMAQQLPHWRNPCRAVQEELHCCQLCSLGSHHQLQQESCVFGAVINVQARTTLSETYLSVWNVPETDVFLLLEGKMNDMQDWEKEVSQDRNVHLCRTASDVCLNERSWQEVTMFNSVRKR